MRALLLTVGSHGDVQPYVALAGRLRGAGHDVVLAAPAVYQGLTQDPFVPLDLDMTEVGRAVEGKHGLRHMLAFTRAMGKQAAKVMPQLTSLAREGADVVVHHPVLPLGQHLAEHLRVPAVVASPLPALVPTSEFLSPAWPGATVRPPAAVNRPSYRAARYLTGAWCRKDVDRWRATDLGLDNSKKRRHDALAGHAGQAGQAGQAGEGVTVLHAFSQHVLPRPQDWPATAHITGYWCTPQASTTWAPPRRLAEFLDAGQPPVYVGFGSMPLTDPARLAGAILAAARETGVRIVLSSLDPAVRRHLGHQEAVTVIRQLPHDWLFPRVSAVVHHGGAGTTGAAVRAGRPQVIWPFGIDQHFWADRMAALGVAARAKPVRALNATTLAAAIDRATSDQKMKSLAAQLADRVNKEDGTGAAVAHLERVAENITNNKVPA
jgi:sterol 3beta-glucosyltransferase